MYVVFVRNATQEQSALWTKSGYQCCVDYWGSWVRECDKDGWGKPDSSIDNWQVCWPNVPIFGTEYEAREYAWDNGGRVRPNNSIAILSRDEWI